MKHYELLKELPWCEVWQILSEEVIEDLGFSKFTEDIKFFKPLRNLDENEIFTTYLCVDDWQIYEELKEKGIYEEDLKTLWKYALSEIEVEYKIVDWKCKILSFK